MDNGVRLLDTGAKAALASNDVLKLATAPGAGKNAVVGDRSMNITAPKRATLLRLSFAILLLVDRLRGEQADVSTKVEKVVLKTLLPTLFLSMAELSMRSAFSYLSV